MNKTYYYDKEGFIYWVLIDGESKTTSIPAQPGADEYAEILSSGVNITPYIEPDKSIQQAQQDAFNAIQKIFIAECRSGKNELYFSDLSAASRQSSDVIQPDSLVRDRAIQLLRWEVAVDNYAQGIVYAVEETGVVPSLEEFVLGLPKL